MVPDTAPLSAWPTAPAGLAALVAADGTGGCDFARRLAMPASAARDLADAIHGLCAVHGGHPGILDHAAARTDNGAAAGWLDEALAGFAAERGHLVQLSAAAGPLPSTPGQAETEVAITAQRHALDMIARSDRLGCGLGAAVALVVDWTVVRTVMVAAADRFGVALSASTLPDAGALATMPIAPAGERAMRFAAQQLLAQHRGLWHLLESRSVARDQL